MRSKFTDSREPLTKSVRRFEQWLRERGFEPSSIDYTGAVHAAALVEDFFDEYPAYTRDRSAIDLHADMIGYVSDCPLEEDNADE